MQVSIVIVNFNTFELTSNCIRSIYNKVSGLDVEIILVDNASHERNPDDFHNIFPEIISVFLYLNERHRRISWLIERS